MRSSFRLALRAGRQAGEGRGGLQGQGCFMRAGKRRQSCSMCLSVGQRRAKLQGGQGLGRVAGAAVGGTNVDHTLDAPWIPHTCRRACALGSPGNLRAFNDWTFATVREGVCPGQACIHQAALDRRCWLAASWWRHRRGTNPTPYPSTASAQRSVVLPRTWRAKPALLRAEGRRAPNGPPS